MKYATIHWGISVLLIPPHGNEVIKININDLKRTKDRFERNSPIRRPFDIETYGPTLRFTPGEYRKAIDDGKEALKEEVIDREKLFNRSMYDKAWLTLRCQKIRESRAQREANNYGHNK
jgi:hypothetical protein